MRVLLFDSGIGGISVLDALLAAATEKSLALELDYLADSAWLPYGEKPDAALRDRLVKLVPAAARAWGVDAVVLACNTASTIALDEVRAALTIPVVGVVPPIKPAAAMSASGVIGLLATPATIRRAYTEELIRTHAADRHVIRHGSSALVRAAEDKLAGAVVDPGVIAAELAGIFAAPGGESVDVIALACTHFPLLREELAAAAPRPVTWLDSGDAVARRTLSVLPPIAVGAPRLRWAGSTAPLPGLRARPFARRLVLGAGDVADP